MSLGAGRTSRPATILAVGALLACAAPGVRAEDGAALRPANLKPAPASIEGGIWDMSDRAEAHLRTSAERDPDAQLADYVRSVVCRIAEDYCGELRVYVVDRPFLNATTFPNGYVEVNSGLLLRARSEGELAYVLGHEVSHFARNHSLASYAKQKTNANITLALTAGVTVGAVIGMGKVASTGAPNASQTIDSISRAAQSLNNLIYLQGMASYFSYSRENEMEADRLGFGRVSAAGYDKSVGVNIWTELIEETQASDFPNVRKSETRASIFATHPLTPDRIKALTALGSAAAPPDREAERRYRAQIRGHLPAWLKDDLRRRDFGETLFLIDRLSGLGEDLGVLNFYRGEAHRQRRAAGDAARAVDAYEAAVGYPDAPPAAWRELGEALRKAGDRPAAVQALETYLAKAPDAEERWLVEASLKSLKGGQ